MELPVLQVPDTVVFPGMTITFELVGTGHRRLVRRVLNQNEHRFLVSLPESGIATGDRHVLPEYGTSMLVLSVDGKQESGYLVTAQGQGRQRIRHVRNLPKPDAVADGDLLLVRDEPAPLGRGTPNDELLEAWDTAAVFVRYAGRFLPARMQSQIGEALPDEPFYVASFICANCVLEPDEQQQLLAAPTLVDRLRLVRSKMRRQLGESASSEEPVTA